MRTFDVLSQKSLVMVFTYAPAGLGHLRVTDALYNGLPEDIPSFLLGSQDKNIMFIHRIFSIHPLLRRLFEWVQYDPQQYIFTWIYYMLTRWQSGLMYEQLNTILDQRIETPRSVLIVATHFGLAHQVGVIKERVERERKVKIILAVQVTDDSPQFMWYVPEADITFVPSRYTKSVLEKYGEWVGHKPVRFEVNAYPVSPVLSQKLDNVEFHEKAHQLDARAKSQIHVSVPISGAAVGLHYATGIMDTLYRLSHRFVFHVVTRSAPYTLTFLNDMIQRPYAKLYVSAQDRDVVNAYEHIYTKYHISLEVTKPSEQAFKTLLMPQQRGGAIMLFSEPVGRQEYDNIDFMRRHGLLPSQSLQERMWKYAEEGHTIEANHDIMQHAKHWRGFELPPDPKLAGRFIWWCSLSGIFDQMMQFTYTPKMKQEDMVEVNPFGVSSFWEKIAQFLRETDRF